MGKVFPGINSHPNLRLYKQNCCIKPKTSLFASGSLNTLLPKPNKQHDLITPIGYYPHPLNP